jgi:hypothetical protein
MRDCLGRSSGRRKVVKERILRHEEDGSTLIYIYI